MCFHGEFCTGWPAAVFRVGGKQSDACCFVKESQDIGSGEVNVEGFVFLVVYVCSAHFVFFVTSAIEVVSEIDHTAVFTVNPDSSHIRAGSGILFGHAFRTDDDGSAASTFFLDRSNPDDIGSGAHEFFRR